MRMQRLLEQANQWFRERSLVQEASQIFALITVVNSIMMVVGLDEPKLGTFAYQHLLGRLGIIVLVVLLWEHNEVLTAFKGWFAARGRGSVTGHNGRSVPQWLRQWLGSITAAHSDWVSVVFTGSVVGLCAVMIASSGVWEPVAGRVLYSGLLIWYGIVHGAALLLRSSSSGPRP